jgi:5-methyltetrahydrofolate--homocysteine methyltransferase
MKPLWINRLLSTGPVLTDGAWGTELQARGLAVGEFPDIWNLHHPDRVAEVARAYVKAGSRVILTNTFGSNRFRLALHGLEDLAAQLNRRGAGISREAAGSDARVFASIGPCGRMLAAGEVTEAELESAFAEQALALAEGGADAIVIETMSDPAEAAIAVAAARKTGLPVAASMVFDAGRAKDRTMTGATPEQAAAALADAGADIIGANCGQGVGGFLEICRRLRAATTLPLWIKPNAGLPRLEDGRAVYGASPEAFADSASMLVEAGASFIGGCCGAGPAYIAATGRRLSLTMTPPS